MNDMKPIYVCSEAFLRCAPWTPITFRLQRNKIVKTKAGEEQSLLQAIECLEAFGVHSDIHSVCAHLRTFKGSELARRVFCNLRDWQELEPCSLPSAVDFSVGLDGNTNAYRAIRIFKGLLCVFLSLCKRLINDDQSHDQRLKETFIDVFEGLSPSNFTLEPGYYGIRRKKKNFVSYWIRVVNISYGDFGENYEKMTNDLAFLAPRWFGMFTRGDRFWGNYQNWTLPAAFRGFELNTKLHDTRDWSAMLSAKVFYNKKPALETVLSDDESKRVHETLKRKNRELMSFSTSEEEEDDEDGLTQLKKIVRREKNILTEDELDLRLQDNIMDYRSATSLESSRIMPATSSFQDNGFNFDRNETNREERHGRDHYEVTTTFVDPRPSSSREKDKPVTSRQGKQSSTAGLEEQPSTSSQEEQPSTSSQEEQTEQPSTSSQEEQLMLEKTSLQVENVISLQTEQGQTQTNMGSCETSSPGRVQEHTIPQSTRNISSEEEAVVSIAQISGTTVTSDASSVRVTCPPSFDINVHHILDRAWQSPDVRRAVDSCIAKLIEQKCKDML